MVTVIWEISKVLTQFPQDYTVTVAPLNLTKQAL